MGNRVMNHAVICAYPALGHINPLLRLSIILLQQGIRVTFVSTRFFCDRLRGVGHGGGARSGPQGQCLGKEAATATKQAQLHPEEEVGEGEEGEGAEDANGCICFEGLPDGLPQEFDRVSPSTELSRAVDKLHPAFEKLMRRLLQSASPVPNLLIADAFLTWTQDVALALLIPRVVFWPMSAAVFTIFRHTDHLLNSGFNPFADDLDTVSARVVDFFPGLPSLPISHLPYRVKLVDGQDRRFLLHKNLTKQFEQYRGASCIFVNSFESLESLPAKVLQSKIEIPLKLVGPLVSLPYVERHSPESMHSVESEEVVEWLNTKADSSVLYICLGSVVSWTKLQLEEVGLGLMAKQQAFLWVVRPWEMERFLPHRLLELGKVVKFAPQIQVLGHPAIGGFLSHCGWNSTLESLSMGVPILAWPHFLDQFTNCWYVVHVWEIGVELGVVRREGVEEAIVDRDEFARAVTLLMEADDGRRMRSRASNLKNLVQDVHHHSLEVILSEFATGRIVT